MSVQGTSLNIIVNNAVAQIRTCHSHHMSDTQTVSLKISFSIKSSTKFCYNLLGEQKDQL